MKSSQNIWLLFIFIGLVGKVRMKRNNRYSPNFIWKTTICILGMAVLFFIAVSYRNYIIKEGKEPYLTVKEMQPSAQAFLQKQGIETYDDIVGKKAADDYVSVKEVKTFLSFFPQVETSVLQEYKKDSWYIGIEDFNRILVELVKVYGEEEIVLCDLIFMGDETIVEDEAGQFLAEDEILTNKGVYRGIYWNVDSYMYSSVRAVCRERDILSVVGYDSARSKRNVYLAGISEDKYHFFTDGYHIYLPRLEEGSVPEVKGIESVSSSYGIYDLAFDKGMITAVSNTNEYMNGKLIQITENGFEIEGHGVYQADEEMKVYRLYGKLASKSKKDLRIGYDFTDFVLQDGKIVACLMIKDEYMEYIRVLLKSTDYAGRYHEEFTAQCNQDYELIYYENGIETKKEGKSAKETFSISRKDFNDCAVRIKLVPTVLSAVTRIDSIGRSQGTPLYRGTIEITVEKEGLLIVNEVLLEDYLRNVVPSEMPASYPKEALMAQAICARTYAYSKMINAGLPALGAHVDDSAGFQVYNNIREQDSTTEAVRATHERIAEYQGNPIGTYYYSTSCGVGSDASVWHGGESPAYLTAKVISPYGNGAGNGNSNQEPNQEMTDTYVSAAELMEEEKFREWIQKPDTSHYEVKEGWYRWSYDVDKLDVSHMGKVLQERYNTNPNQILIQNENGEFESRNIPELGKIQDIRITKRLSGGVADELIITASETVIKVMTELNIRYVLSDGKTKVLRQSGDYVNASATLPSAFLILDLDMDGDEVIGYSVKGGGFGHGVGMSQNGAKNMAENGMTCEEILSFFYPGVEIKTLQFGE